MSKARTGHGDPTYAIPESAVPRSGSTSPSGTLSIQRLAKVARISLSHSGWLLARATSRYSARRSWLSAAIRRVDLLALRQRDRVGVAHRDQAVVRQADGPAHVIAPQLLAMALPHAFAQGGDRRRVDLEIGLGLRQRGRSVDGKLQHARRARKQPRPMSLGISNRARRSLARPAGCASLGGAGGAASVPLPSTSSMMRSAAFSAAAAGK